MVIDKDNIFPGLAGNNSVVLDIGCGQRKKNPHSIGIDVLDLEGVNVVGDVFEVLTLFPEQSVDGVYSSHFFEHVIDLPKLLGELERVLKSGAELKVIVPHFSNPYFYSDPTHRIFFGLYTFCYYADCDLFSNKVPTYARIPQFKLQRVRLRFKSPPPFYLRYGVKRVIEVIVNFNAYTQELYEDIFSSLVACYEIEFTLIRK